MTPETVLSKGVNPSKNVEFATWFKYCWHKTLQTSIVRALSVTPLWIVNVLSWGNAEQTQDV